MFRGGERGGGGTVGQGMGLGMSKECADTRAGRRAKEHPYIYGGDDRQGGREGPSTRAATGSNRRREAEAEAEAVLVLVLVLVLRGKRKKRTTRQPRRGRQRRQRRQRRTRSS